MRGEDIQQDESFSYGSLEERLPASHPLRPIRAMVDLALKSLDGRFREIYGEDGRKSIPPERLLRAAAADAVHGAERAPADGKTGIQLAVLLVYRALDLIAAQRDTKVTR